MLVIYPVVNLILVERLVELYIWTVLAVSKAYIHACTVYNVESLLNYLRHVRITSRKINSELRYTSNHHVELPTSAIVCMCEDHE